MTSSDHPSLHQSSDKQALHSDLRYLQPGGSSVRWEERMLWKFQSPWSYLYSQNLDFLLGLMTYDFPLDFGFLTYIFSCIFSVYKPP